MWMWAMFLPRVRQGESQSLRDVFTCSVTLRTNRSPSDRNMTEWSGVTSDFRGHATTSFRCCCSTLLSSPLLYTSSTLLFVPSIFLLYPHPRLSPPLTSSACVCVCALAALVPGTERRGRHLSHCVPDPICGSKHRGQRE